MSHHISSAKQLLSVGGALVILTILTVAVAQIHIPSPYNIVVAIAIAAVKAALVAAFFMNLYWDSKFNLMLLFFGVVFISLLFGLTLLDTMFRETITAPF